MSDVEVSSTLWPKVRVGDLCQSINGRAFKSTEWAKQGLPIIRIQNLNRKDASFNYFEGTVDEKILVRSGDLLFAWSGTPGTSFGAHIWRGPDAALNQHIFKLRFDPLRVDAKYFYYALNRNVAGYIDTAQGGVGLAHVTKSKFENSVVSLPELRVQREVVAELEKQFSRLDEAVANLKRVKANLKRYKASVLKDAVEGRLVPTEAELARREGRSFETGEQLLLRILEARRSSWSGRGKFRVSDAPELDASELPEGWTWSTIDQLADVGTGATPNRSKVEYWNDGDVPWVTSGVANGDYVDKASEFVTQRALAETNLTLYPAGTLLVAMYGEGKTRGKCAELRIPATTNQALAALQVNDQVRAYLRHFLELNYEEMRKVASGGVQPNLNLSLVRAVSVSLPPLSEQVRIVAEVDRRMSLVRGAEAEVDANLKRAQALRQSILQSTFRESANVSR